MFSHIVQYSYRIAFGIDLTKYSIFLAPEFYLCGSCGCIKNRGEILNHLEECFTKFLNGNNDEKSFRIKDKFIRERVSYALAILEFGFNNNSKLLLFYCFLFLVSLIVVHIKLEY